MTAHGQSKQRIIDVLAILEMDEENSYVPNIRELAELVGLAPSTVQVHVNDLVAAGYLTRIDNEARSLRTT